MKGRRQVHVPSKAHVPFGVLSCLLIILSTRALARPTTAFWKLPGSLVQNQDEAFLSDVPEKDAAEPALNGELHKPPVINFQPLIGILSQPGDGDGGLAPRLARDCSSQKGSPCTRAELAALHRKRNRNLDDMSYIAASYVKWVESAGARPVHILYDEPPEERARKFGLINGLIIPGGGTPLVPGPFMDAVNQLLDLAVAANDAGDFFPVQATCMGLEAITIYISQNYSILQTGYFASSNDNAALIFRSENAKTESLFGWMSPKLLKHVQTQGLTMENHADGTTVERFMSNARLASFFNILTTSVDKNGTEYVSTVAAKRYPFYGTQWHPEKNAFEWGMDHIPHSAEGVAVCQAAANFFVNEARRSTHAPTSLEEMDDALIYNHNPLFSGKNGEGFFEQSYVFKKDANPPLPGIAVE